MCWWTKFARHRLWHELRKTQSMTFDIVFVDVLPERFVMYR